MTFIESRKAKRAWALTRRPESPRNYSPVAKPKPLESRPDEGTLIVYSERYILSKGRELKLLLALSGQSPKKLTTGVK